MSVCTCVCVCVSPCHYSEGWIIVCSSSEEWEEAVEELNGSKRHETKQLYRYLNDVLLPDVLSLRYIDRPPLLWTQYTACCTL